MNYFVSFFYNLKRDFQKKIKAILKKFLNLHPQATIFHPQTIIHSLKQHSIHPYTNIFLGNNIFSFKHQ